MRPSLLALTLGSILLMPSQAHASWNDCDALYVDSSAPGQGSGTPGDPYNSMTTALANVGSTCTVLELVGDLSYPLTPPHTVLPPLGVRGGWLSGFSDYGQLAATVELDGDLAIDGVFAITDITLLMQDSDPTEIFAEGFHARDAALHFQPPPGYSGGLRLEAEEVSLTDSSVQADGWGGLTILGATRSRIENNTITGRVWYRFDDGATPWSHHVLSGNTITGRLWTECVQFGDLQEVELRDIDFGVEITDNHISSCQDGLNLYGVSGVIADNVIRDSNENIHMSRSGRSFPVVILHNRFHGGSQNAVHVTHFSESVVVANNVFVAEQDLGHGLYMNTTRHGTIRSNVFAGFDREGIRVGNSLSGQPTRDSEVLVVDNIVYANNLAQVPDAGGLVVDEDPQLMVTIAYNDFWWNKRAAHPDASQDSVEIGDGNLYVNPEFVDPMAGDFSLQPGSPLESAGSRGWEMGAYGGLFPDWDTPWCDLVFDPWGEGC